MKDINIDSILEDLQSSFSSRISIGSKDALQAVETWISTGSTLLDSAIKQGLPAGRVIEFIGKSGTGKSALGFSVLAQTQKLGGIGVLLDSECAADLDFAQKFGVDVNRLVIAVPETVEDIYELTKNIVTKLRETLDKKYPITVVADSCTISTTEEAAKTMMEVQKMAENAKVQRRGLRSLLSFINENNVLFIGINHITANLSPYGAKETSTGASAWEFFPSVRIKIGKLTKIENTKTNAIEAVQMEALVIKNRHDFPFRKALLYLSFENGFDDILSLIEFGKEVGIIGKKGGWMTFNGETYRKPELIEKLKTNPEALELLKEHAVKVMRTAQVPDLADETK